MSIIIIPFSCSSHLPSYLPSCLLVLARGAQVVVANNAIVSVVDGQIRFQVRAYDVDAAHPVIEAHIRMYAVTKGRPVPRPLRILQPDDELGGMLFLSVPTVVSHQVDVYSILHPPVETPIRPCGLLLRSVDSETCNREEMICPVCGESYGTYERLAKSRHVSTHRGRKRRLPCQRYPFVIEQG